LLESSLFMIALFTLVSKADALRSCTI